MDYQKNNILENQGWVEIEFSSETINFLDNLISLNHSLDLEIKDKFSKEDSFQNEVAQAAKTSILRYSNQSKIFVKSMVKDLLQHHSFLSEYFITPPYIITHPANELREEGGYHSDTIKYCGKSYTSWTPINNYNMEYPPLALFNKSHSYILKIINKTLNKFKLSNNIEQVFKYLLIDRIDLSVKKNFTYLWHSDLIHKGNRNNTDKPHAALVTRISEKPLYYEPTERISEIINNQHLNNDENEINLNNLFTKIKDICEVANKNSNLINYSKNLKESIDRLLLKHISFSLSVLALRFNNSSSSNLDMISFILSKENLVSLERFLIKFKDQEISNEIIKSFFDNDLSYQETLIIKKFKNQDLNNLDVKKNIRWLET
jgi:hypothetical protein